MRAFIAIPMPEQTASALVRLQNTLPYARPVPEENLHLTLAFLDDVKDDVLEELHLDLSQLRAPPVPIRFTTLAVFPATRQRLIVAEVAPDRSLTELEARLSATIRRVGIDLPRRRFRPHVTLTRDRVAPAVLPGQLLDVPPFTATEFCLYRSTLSHRGARHDMLASYKLS